MAYINPNEKIQQMSIYNNQGLGLIPESSYQSSPSKNIPPSLSNIIAPQANQDFLDNYRKQFFKDVSVQQSFPERQNNQNFPEPIALNPSSFGSGIYRHKNNGENNNSEPPVVINPKQLASQRRANYLADQAIIDPAAYEYNPNIRNLLNIQPISDAEYERRVADAAVRKSMGASPKQSSLDFIRETPGAPIQDMADAKNRGDKIISKLPIPSESGLIRETMSDAQRMEAQKGVPTTTDSAAIREANRINEITAQLKAEGFKNLNDLSENKDAKSGASNLGLNDIMVRERLGSPEEYRKAVYNNQLAAMRGRQLGITQDPNVNPYTLNDATNTFNDATKTGLDHGGAITEYAIPGKGTATFMGDRKGGGTFSVISGRTPEEQADIDATVAGINKQTAAMRSLRNAQRQAQGLPTVEQEEQDAAIARDMRRFMPDTGKYDAQQQEWIQRLIDAQGLSGNKRDDATKMAQLGLSQVNAERQAAMQAGQNALSNYYNQQNHQAQQQAATNKAAIDQVQWGADYLLRSKEFQNKSEKDQVKTLMDAYGLSQKDAEIRIAQAKANNQGASPESLKYIFTKGINPDGSETYSYDYNNATKLYPKVPENKEAIVPYQVYASPAGLIMYDPSGQVISAVGHPNK